MSNEQWYPIPGGAWMRLRLDKATLASDLAVFESREAPEPVAVWRQVVDERGHVHAEGDERAEQAAVYLQELRDLYYRVEPGVSLERFTHIYLEWLASPDAKITARKALRGLPRKKRNELAPKLEALFVLHRKGVLTHG